MLIRSLVVARGRKGKTVKEAPFIVCLSVALSMGCGLWAARIVVHWPKWDVGAW